MMSKEAYRRDLGGSQSVGCQLMTYEPSLRQAETQLTVLAAIRPIENESDVTKKTEGSRVIGLTSSSRKTGGGF